MHKRLMSNVGPFFFFFSDLSQFLHVGFVLFYSCIRMVYKNSKDRFKR